MIVGTLQSIWVYPLKSCAGDSLTEAAVTTAGLEGDRERALIVRDGHARVGKTYRGKEHELLGRTNDLAAAQAMAAERGVDVEVGVDSEGRFFDDAPVSIVVDRWLDGLSGHVGYRVEIERFRPNFSIAAAAGFGLDEAALSGRVLGLGEVALRVRYPIERCVVTTYDPAGGDADPRILRYIAAARSTWMGIYCDVLRAGTVRIGDSLAVVER
jgi:hypothetical protein